MGEVFYPTKVDALSFTTLHIYPLGVTDAFVVDDVTFETSCDSGTVLEIGPDILFHSYSTDSYCDVVSTCETLENHPVRGELSVIRDNHIYPSGTPV